MISPPPQQHGFSLVELLLSVGLSVLIMGFMLQLYHSNKVTQRTQEGLSQLQQNSRFASYIMTKNMRLAGFQGCVNPAIAAPNNLINNAATNLLFTADQFILGYEALGSGWTPNLPSSLSSVTRGTDVITVYTANAKTTALTAAMSSKSSPLQVTDRLALQAGDVILISDCESTDIFMAGAGTSRTTITHTATDNSSANLSKLYDTTAQIAKLETYTYYIQDSGRRNSSNQPILSLYRMNNIDNSTVEISDGIENMQITYGLDSDGNGVSDTFTTANNVANWNTVKSVRISQLVNTIDEVSPIPQNYTFVGNTVTPTDRILRKQNDIYVTLRNKR